MVAVTAGSATVTGSFAAAFAASLKPGDLVLLHGSIGAGKTTFVSAACAALGLTEPVRSPTYTVGNTYELPGGEQIAHLDLYREQGLTVEAYGDIEPYFDATYAFIEWPAAALGWLGREPEWVVRLEMLDLDRRLLRISGSRSTEMVVLVDSLLELVR